VSFMSLSVFATQQIPARHVDRSAPARRVAALLVVACIALASMASGVAADSHADAGHGSGHGDGHHVEIGHNPPAGYTREAFENPAWFQKDLALWSLAVFGGLLFLLTKFAWKPIMEGLQKREQGIADLIAQTQRSSDEAKRMLSSYERRLAEASEEVRGMLEEARRDAETTKQTIVAEARKAAEEERNRAKHEIHLAKDDALSQIAEKAGHLAVEVAGKFLREKMGADDQARLVRDSVASLSRRPSVN